MLLGRKPELAPEQSLMDGINAGRKLDHLPSRASIRDAHHAGLWRRFPVLSNRVGLWCKAWAFKKTPDHGWASHGADAWRYLSLSWRAPMREPEEEKAALSAFRLSWTLSFDCSSWTSKSSEDRNR